MLSTAQQARSPSLSLYTVSLDLRSRHIPALEPAGLQIHKPHTVAMAHDDRRVLQMTSNGMRCTERKTKRCLVRGCHLEEVNVPRIRNFKIEKAHVRTGESHLFRDATRRKNTERCFKKDSFQQKILELDLMPTQNHGSLCSDCSIVEPAVTHSLDRSPIFPR